MRHFLLFGAITVLAGGVLQASLAGLLIAPAGITHGAAPRRLGAAARAINIAAVTAAADQHLAVTAGTVVQASGVFHRRQRPMRT